MAKRYPVHPLIDGVQFYFDYEKFEAALVKRHAAHALPHNQCRGCHVAIGHEHYVFFDLEAIEEHKREDGDYALHHTFAHEALHVAARVWDNAGANLCSIRNDEVLAYTMNYVMRCAYKEWDKFNKRSK